MQPDLESRIAALERSNRRLRLAFSLLAAAAIALLTMAMNGEETTPFDDLQVRSLDVINDEGMTVVHLGVRSSGAGGFWLTDAQGRRVVHLNQNAHGAGRVAASAADGKVAAELTADADGQGQLNLDRAD